MHLDDANYDRLSNRVKRLERTNLILKIGGLFVLSWLGLSLLGSVRAQDKAQPEAHAAKKTLEAQEFILKNSGGRTMGQLTVDQDGTALLELYDANGSITWSSKNGPNRLLQVK